MNSEPCRNCRERPGRWMRGLCHPCYQAMSPRARKRYPKLRNGDQGIVSGSGKIPAEPTNERPGTEAKILVMIQRAERGECLFHPRDARNGDGSREEEILTRLAMSQAQTEEDEGDVDSDEATEGGRGRRSVARPAV